MGRAPARPVRMCFVQKWCGVPKATFEAPDFTLHSSHSTLHTSHSTIHLISSQFTWALLSSCQVISASDIFCCKDQTPHCTLHISFDFISPANSSRHLISPYLFSHASWPLYRRFTSSCHFQSPKSSQLEGLPHPLFPNFPHPWSSQGTLPWAAPPPFHHLHLFHFA